jgi:hypothetical protein
MTDGDAEIARLRLEAAHAEIARLRLTDAEREAVEFCAKLLSTGGGCEWADALRGLLERLK